MTRPKKPAKMKPWSGWCVVDHRGNEADGIASVAKDRGGLLSGNEHWVRVIVRELPARRKTRRK